MVEQEPTRVTPHSEPGAFTVVWPGYVMGVRNATDQADAIAKARKAARPTYTRPVRQRAA